MNHLMWVRIRNKISDRLQEYYHRSSTWDYPFLFIFLDLCRFLFFLYPIYAAKFLKSRMLKHSHSSVKVPENRFMRIELSAVEGVGAQVAKQAMAMILARKLNLTYVHSPLKSSFHDKTSPLDWEKFFGFGNEEILYSAVNDDRNDLRTIELPVVMMTLSHSNFIFSFIRFLTNTVYQENGVIFLLHGYPCLAPQKFLPESQQVYAFLRHRYESNIDRSKYNPFTTGKISVAIHIRRAEIAKLKKKEHWQAKWRWSPISWYISVLKNITEILNNDALQIHAYSDADSVDEVAELLKFDNLTMHLKKDAVQQPFEAFHAMVVADIGICSASGFSTLAGHLSDGIKLLPPSKNYYREIILTDRWLKTGDDGSFDSHKFRSLLKESNSES